MKKLTLSAFALALIAAAPAYAQSAFVMIVGEAPAPAAETREQTPATREQLVERIVERVCARPAIRDLNAQMAYRACSKDVREQLGERELELAQLAAR
ncbi:hypothetical protein [Aurantiacibacter poecillastricola]|uniref:hypothetical protein n=1 Tax=Aurantiacibacter poecillastricola TaxID=3064385 RepID=UPI00273DB9CC|nr:hypothetical protein [Aurantiacibacter sp. 219JJ12-13]MDP5260799.1 hypothetical protein [Aurantiacibacter sp. 219JJ12-13]